MERLLSLLTDRRAAPPSATLERIVEASRSGALRILEAQALRALGAAGGDVALLSQAIVLLDLADAAPYAARARIERAQLTGDGDELAAGIRVLESLRDFDYLSRVEQYARRRE
jgi:hypothetical protein